MTRDAMEQDARNRVLARQRNLLRLGQQRSFLSRLIGWFYGWSW